MARYYFKGFFNTKEKVLLHNDEWVCNGHFMFKKSILTKQQLEFIEKHNKDEQTISRLFENLSKYKEYFEDTEDQQLLFNPTHYSKNGKQVVLYDIKNEYAINKEYYTYFTSRKCDIYAGSSKINPGIIYKKNEFIGFIMPVRFSTDIENLETIENIA